MPEIQWIVGLEFCLDLTFVAVIWLLLHLNLGFSFYSGVLPYSTVMSISDEPNKI